MGHSLKISNSYDEIFLRALFTISTRYLALSSLMNIHEVPLNDGKKRTKTHTQREGRASTRLEAGLNINEMIPSKEMHTPINSNLVL